LTRMSWAEARVSFEEAMAVRASAEALEGLSLAAWWLDDAPAMFGARERAYALYQRRRWSSYAAVSSSPIEAAPYLCRDHEASARFGLLLLRVVGATRDWRSSAGGGALSPLGRPGGPSAERLTGAVLALLDGGCARAPGLISVHGPGWLRVGDMMVAGVIPQKALRPLGLSGPSTWAWRQEHAGSRPRRIGVMRGCARMNTSSGGRQRLLAEL
jgi:hypothetical protein